MVLDEASSDMPKRKRDHIENSPPKKTSSGAYLTMYDERGIMRENNKDFCDCLDMECPGCFFPCPKCKSQKCGLVCRVSRKWCYESITQDGKPENIKNPIVYIEL